MSEVETSLERPDGRSQPREPSSGEAATALAPAVVAPPVPSAPADPYVGTLVGDRYRILGPLGEGGMGRVYRAEHTLMKKVVALKLLHRELGEKDEAVRRFEREAQSASRLSHPCIISVTDFGKAATGELFLVMELARGEALFDVISREGRLPLRRALAITRQILRGLAHAHSQGIVHRDLKPANIMIVPPGTAGTVEETVKILDFGIAKMVASAAAAGAEGGATLTQSGMIFGTPSYMSPEQATAQDADARSDLYSTGIVLYEMLAGRKPFIADDLVKVMAMQVTQPAPSFAKAAPDAGVPTALESVVMRVLDKDRTKRFQSATEFLDALDEAEQAEPGLVALARRVSDGWPAAAAQARTKVKAQIAWLKAEPKRVRTAGSVAAVVLGLALVTPLLSRDKGRDVAAPMKPKPVEAALVTPIKRAEEAIARGQLTVARATLMQQLSQHPDSGRVRYLLGTIEFLERRPAEGLVAYTDALGFDPGLRSDAALLLNVRGLLDDKRLGRDALDLMIEKIGKPAAEPIADVGTADKRGEFRRAAREGCARLGCLDRIDLVKSYSLDLSQAKTCDEKRQAVKGLASTTNARAVDVLKKARRERGGPFGLFGGNDCVRKDIDAALEALGGKG